MPKFATNEGWHQCPGGCGQDVRNVVLACAPCWYRLPKDMRTTLVKAWRNRMLSTQHAAAHLALVVQARVWYREHPPEPGTPAAVEAAHRANEAGNRFRI